MIKPEQRKIKSPYSSAALVAGLFFAVLLFTVHCPGKSSLDAQSASREPIYTDPLYNSHAYEIPVYEIYPYEEDDLKEIPVSERKPAKGIYLPKIAIIIDDIGYDPKIVKHFLELETELTYSIFPFCPFKDSITKQIREKGMEMMLHIPMEPNEYPDINPGKNALLSNMSPDRLVKALEYNLEQVKDIKGVNNHMGSKLTTIPSQMYLILSVLKQRKLFFIDSVTSPDTICRTSARVFQIPFASRDVFLDHIQEPGSIKRQFKRLLRVAETYGEAVGIGHPYKATYEVLKKELPLLKEKVQIVPASKIVHTIG